MNETKCNPLQQNQIAAQELHELIVVTLVTRQSSNALLAEGLDRDPDPAVDVRQSGQVEYSR